MRLSCPIGAGKTTVAAERVRSAEGALAYIEGETFWKYLVPDKPGTASPASTTSRRS